MYVERPSTVHGAVVWRATSSGSDTLILPDGCIDVISIDGALIVAGPDPVARRHRSPVGSNAIGLRFAPGQAPAVLSLDAEALLGMSIDFEGSGAHGARATDSLGRRIATADEPCSVLESAFRSRADETTDLLREAVVELIRAGQPIGEIGPRVGLSSRQLQRRSQQWFGDGPKHLSAILRLQRALALARSGVGAPTAAARAGYADQSHLIRDAGRLTGETFGALIAGDATLPAAP